MPDDISSPLLSLIKDQGLIDDLQFEEVSGEFKRSGKPVAQITPAPVERRQIQWGAMSDRIKLLPGWDDPVDLDRFLAGEI